MARSLPLYLPNLNGVRFIAAFTVILSHVEQYRSALGLEHLAHTMGVFAGYGVDIFFALSGFLITYLLIVERQRNATVHIPHFYVRRIFRIWPLYFLILAVTTIMELFLSEHSPLLQPFNGDAWWYYLLFLPQIGKAFYTGSLPMVILWSIGVEELFYLIFPWIFRVLGLDPVRRLGVLVAFILVAKVVVIYLLFKFVGGSMGDSLIKVVSTIRFENLLVGSMVAFLALRHQELVIQGARALFPLLALLLMLFGLSALGINFYVSESIGPILQRVLNPFMVSGIVAMILTLLAFAPRWSKLLEHPLLNYLGKISYGLYVYHCIVFVLLTLLPDYMRPASWWLITVFGTCLTILISGLSYRFFEKPFLSKSGAYRHI
jgi:peptidoglycan/LPS O-acetylase OafA/YrhL